MKPRIYKAGDKRVTYYFLIPKDVVESLNISPNDEFILNVEKQNGELALVYKRVKPAP